MLLNTAKCSHVTIGRSPNSPTEHCQLNRLCKFVGIGVTSGLIFIQCLHHQQAEIRARRILFQLRRGFAVLTPEIFRPMCLALVRPILDYSQQASLPHHQRGINLMERTQQLTTRLVKSLRELSYKRAALLTEYPRGYWQLHGLH